MYIYRCMYMYIYMCICQAPCSLWSCFGCCVPVSYQVLAIEHEGAQGEEQMPYLQCKWPHLLAIQFWSRSATMQPVCDNPHAVFHWWRDCQKGKKSI